jgi:hypothetical protein
MRLVGFGVGERYERDREAAAVFGDFGETNLREGHVRATTLREAELPGEVVDLGDKRSAALVFVGRQTEERATRDALQGIEIAG